MKYIQIDKKGNILFLGDHEPMVTEDQQCIATEISEKAYWYLRNHNIKRTMDTSVLRYHRPGILRLSTEDKEQREDEPDSIISFRIENIFKGWGKLSRDFMAKGIDLPSLGFSEIEDTLVNLLGRSPLSSSGDAAIIAWLNQTKPRHEVMFLSPDACTLIENSRIDDIDVKEVPLLCLIAKDGFLCENVTELVIYYDGPDLSFMAARKLAPKLYGYEYGPFYNDNIDPAIQQFIRKYLAIRSAEKSPIEAVDRESLKLERKGIKKTSGVFRYSVSLSKRYKAIRREKHEAMDKTGKVLTTVNVSGFVRNQPYGEGRKERKLIWVDGFTRGQWVRQGVTYVTVKD